MIREGTLHCDGVPVEAIARATGTPVYVYSGGSIRAAYAALDGAFQGYPHTLHFALKANSTLAVLRLLRGLGCSADANSGGEIEAARRAGFEPAHIVFTGVGKTRDELDRAVALGVKAINIESDGEAERIDAIARARGVRARVALRVNPDIDPNTHAHISTGLRFNKFGVPMEFAAALLRRIASMPGLEPVGIHVHLGSQIVDVAPLGRAARALADPWDARRGRWLTWRPRCGPPACRCGTSTLAGASASRTTASRLPTRRRTPRRSCPPSGRPAWNSSSNRAATLWQQPAHWSAAWPTPRRTKGRRASSCSTPA
jgi:diaminopimelate decarboxylase